MTIRYLTAFCVVLLLASCASSVPPAAGIPAAETIAFRLNDREIKINSMKGKGSVSFESRDVAGSAFFSLSLKKPDSLLIMFEGPFGIDAGFFFLSRERYVLYNSFDNRAIVGMPSSGVLRGVIPIDLTLDQIMEAFTGGFRLPKAVPERYGMDENLILAVYRREGKLHRYWIDPGFPIILRYEVRDSSETPLVEASMSRIVEKSGIPVPAHVSLTFPQDGRQLTIHYTTIEVNGEELSFDYTIPPNARTTIR